MKVGMLRSSSELTAGALTACLTIIAPTACSATMRRMRSSVAGGTAMGSVTAALGSYTCDILALVEEGNQVFGKLRFHGIHRKELLGVPPTGRHVWWYGAPVFTFEGGLVRDLWVLGDVHGLLQRLRGESSPTPAES